MTITILPELTAVFALVFARVGTLVMLMPGLGERFALARARLVLALFMALLMVPMARQGLTVPREGPELVALLIGEVLVGLVLGLAVRMIVASLQTAGTIIAQQLGLGFAMTVDPAAGVQNPSIGNLLTILGTTLVLVTDLHHVAIAAIHESYRVLPPGGAAMEGDAARLVLGTFARSFSLAVQMSAPFIVFGLLFNLGLGVLSRLMPQLQVFFLAVPASILMGMVALLAVVGVMMSIYLGAIGETLRLIMGG